LLNLRNLVDFLARCIEHPAAAGETFLVSDNEDLSTADLARHLAVAMRSKLRLFPVPPWLSYALLRIIGRQDVWHRLFGSLQVNGERARDVLGWNPPVSLTEGLGEVATWYMCGKHGP